jgi:hypothetical protein
MTDRIAIKRLALALVTIGSCTATIASAALPPKYQRLRELEAILASSEVTGAFPDSELIVGIEYVRPDRYRVRSAKCRLDVVLKDVPLPSGMVGPRQFSVKPGRIACVRT